MRRGLWTLIVLAALGSSALAASAFNYAQVPRTVGVAIVADSLAYLQIAAYGGSPHRCFVDVGDTSPNVGKVSLTFDTPTSPCGAGAGTGINAGDGSDATKYSRYAFHDLLTVTNKAPNALFLWVNSTSDSGASSAIEVALESATNQMTDSDYGTALSRTGSQFGIGQVLYMGVRVKSGTLTGGTLSGTIRVETRE